MSDGGDTQIPSLGSVKPELGQRSQTYIQHMLFGIVLATFFAHLLGPSDLTNQVQIDELTVVLLLILIGVSLLHRVKALNLDIGGTSFGLELSNVSTKTGWVRMEERAEDIRESSDLIKRESLEMYDSVLSKLSDEPIEALRELRRSLRELLTSVCGYEENSEQYDERRGTSTRTDGGVVREPGGKLKRSSSDSWRLSGVDMEVIHDILYLVDISIYACKRGDTEPAQIKSVVDLGLTAITLLQAEEEFSLETERNGDLSPSIESISPEEQRTFDDIDDRAGITGTQTEEEFSPGTELDEDHPPSVESKSPEENEKLKDLGDKAGIASFFNNRGLVSLEQSDYEAAREYFMDSLQLREELGNQASIANSLGNLGMVDLEQGYYETAREYFEHSLDIQRELDNQAGIATSLENLGVVDFEEGNYEAAREYFERSLDIHEELDDQAGIATSLENLGMVAFEQSEYDTAQRLFERSLTLQQELDDRAGIASNLGNLGLVAFEQEDYETAQEYFGDILEIQDEYEPPPSR